MQINGLNQKALDTALTSNDRWSGVWCGKS